MMVYVVLAVFHVLGIRSAPAAPGGDLHDRFSTISRQARGRVGIAVELLETGEATVLHGSERFPMQSVYKLPIAMAVLHRSEAGRLPLDRQVRVERRDYVSPPQHSPLRDAHPGGADISVRDLLRYMVSESDGSACDVLLRMVGGPGHVTRFLRGIGAQGMVVATTEKAMGRDELVQYRNWATPRGAIGLLRLLHTGRTLSAPSRKLLLEWMTESPTGPHRIRGLLPPGARVAHKTGSSQTVGGLARATNDVGIISLPDGRHLAIAVFVADSKADEATRERVIAEAAKAAWDFWKQ